MRLANEGVQGYLKPEEKSFRTRELRKDTKPNAMIEKEEL